MYRLLLIAGLLVLFYYLLRRVINKINERGGVLSRSEVHAQGSQMVQDPVCRVFIPRASAVCEEIGGQTYFFCSTGCAKVFQNQLSH
ncbi:MAG: YHS domain-containing protein [Nitrospira sp.]|nr:YHS domain-containing protein [Nitrospira sp.]